MTWHRNPVFFSLTFLLVLLCQGYFVQAQPPNEAYPFEIKIEGRYQVDADVEGGPGSVSVAQGGASFHFSHFAVFYENRSFFWDDAGMLPFGNSSEDPWDHLHVIGLRARYDQTISGPWRFFTGARVFSSFEEELDKSWGGAVHGGIEYVFSPSFTLGVGAAFFGDYTRTNVFPLVRLVWMPDPQKGFGVFLGIPETSVRYRFSSKWAAKIGIQFDHRTYRLGDDSPVQPEGYVEMEEFIPGVYLEFNPVPNFSVSAGAEYALGREWTLYNDDGNEVDEVDLDDAIGGNLKFSYRF